MDKRSLRGRSVEIDLCTPDDHPVLAKLLEGFTDEKPLNNTDKPPTPHHLPRTNSTLRLNDSLQQHAKPGVQEKASPAILDRYQRIYTNGDDLYKLSQELLLKELCQTVLHDIKRRTVKPRVGEFIRQRQRIQEQINLEQVEQGEIKPQDPQ